MLVLREARRLIRHEHKVAWPEEWTNVVEEPEPIPEPVGPVALPIRNELGAFGLIDQGTDGPPALSSLSGLSDLDGLGAFGLLGARTGGPADRRSLDAFSPRELLGALSLSIG